MPKCQSTLLNPSHRYFCSVAGGAAIFVGLMLHLVAIIAPSWAYVKNNQHHPFEGLGLWRNCTWDEVRTDIRCESLLFNSRNPAWVYGAQVLESVSVVLLLGATLCLFALRPRPYHLTKTILLVFLGLTCTAVLFILATLVVVGLKVPGLVKYQLGWCYIVDAIAIGLFIVSVLAGACRLVINERYPESETYSLVT